MSFFKKVFAFIGKAFGSTNWEQTAITTLNILGPLVVSIVAFAGGPAAAMAVQVVIGEVTRDLAILMGLVQTFHMGDHATISARILTLSAEIKANLNSILEGGHIKNPALVTKVETIVNTVAGELDAIQKSLPAAKAVAPAAEPSAQDLAAAVPAPASN